MTVKFLPSGDGALIVQFGDRIDRAVSEKALRLSASIRQATLAGVIETVPTFRSLMVNYDPLRTTAAQLQVSIQALLRKDTPLAQRRRLWRIPVCYEGDLAPDLPYVAEQTGLTVDKVVALHAATRFHVYMIGFLPGYPYMGDLPKQLVLPRRVDPRVRVPAGSVAIATTLTAIYPLESPGGWHLIGSTPIRLFDAGWSVPALLAPGDAVQFEPIDRRAHERLGAAVRRGDYRVPHEKLAA